MYACIFLYMKEKEKVKNQKKFWFPNSEFFFLFPTLGVTSLPYRQFRSCIFSCLPTLHTQGPPFLATLKGLSNSLLRGEISASTKCQPILSLLSRGTSDSVSGHFLAATSVLLFTTKNDHTLNVTLGKNLLNGFAQAVILAWSTIHRRYPRFGKTQGLTALHTALHTCLGVLPSGLLSSRTRPAQSRPSTRPRQNGRLPVWSNASACLRTNRQILGEAYLGPDFLLGPFSLWERPK